MGLQIRCGGISPVFVHFAVNADQSLVFIKGVTLQPKPT
jgi:hypothetical protein